MRTLPLAALAALVFSPLAHADKYWLSDPDQQQQAVEGSRPDVIAGVLIDQDERFYHLRVAGGELWLPKAQVHKVEADGLTVAAVEQQEKEAAPALAEAERQREREQVMAQEAAAERERAAAEASFQQSQLPPAPAPLPSAVAPVYDPVLDVVTDRLPDLTLLRDLELAYELTQDRRYIKALRVLRRLR